MLRDELPSRSIKGNHKLLREELASKLVGRVVYVGVGNPRRGDDGAGTAIADLLAGAGVEGVIDSRSSPELDTWRIKELAPRTVLFLDAVDFGGAPGDVTLLTPAELGPGGFDTHKPALKLTMEYLELELNSKCYLLAIQPGHVRFGSPMSDEVRRSVENLGQLITETAPPSGPGSISGSSC